jgi:ankyrin repeat protein
MPSICCLGWAYGNSTCNLLHVQTPVTCRSAFDLKFQSAINVAASNGHEETVQVLCSLKGDGNLNFFVTEGPSEICGTPLLAAAAKGQENMVKLLLSMKADVNAGSLSGKSAVYSDGDTSEAEDRREQRTALHAAAEKGHAEVTRILVNAKADLFSVNSESKTCLESSKDEKMKHFLYQLGGFSPLMIAASESDILQIRSLLAQGSDLGYKGIHGRTALHEAACRGEFDVLRELLTVEPDVNVHDDYGRSVLDVTANAQCRKLLISRGADGWTALMLAAADNNVDQIQLLIQQGCDVNALARNNRSALHVASKHGHIDCFLPLVRAKADLNAQDEKSKSPLELACNYHRRR